MQNILIIAEAGVNHNGSMEMAKQLVDVAKIAGADIVKFQTFTADKLVSKTAPKADYQNKNDGTGESQHDMLRKLELSYADHVELIAYCKQKNIRFLSTAFDEDSIEMLNQLGITTGKIPSGEITNLPYLVTMAKKFNHLIVSTGMCTMDEISDALQVVISNGVSKDKITVLHCNTEYPTPFEDVNLNAMKNMGLQFGVEMGYSDHTSGIEVAIAAAALGAKVIEKHFTLDKKLPGPDHKASLDPGELKQMIAAIRNIEKALGDGIKKPSASEIKNIPAARKSIHLKHAMIKDAVLAATDLVMKRPGDGISPMDLNKVIGKKMASGFPADHKLNWAELI